MRSFIDSGSRKKSLGKASNSKSWQFAMHPTLLWDCGKAVL
jgi:hypothetical protein